MNVRRFLADNMQDAMNRIKNEMGPDAVILNSRNIRKKGIKGFFSKPMVEVVAAFDRKAENALKENNTNKRKAKDSEIKDDRISSLEEKINSMNKMVAVLVNNAKSTPRVSYEKYSDKLVFLLNKLIDNNVDEKIALKIADEVQSIINRQEANEYEVMSNIIEHYLGEPRPIALKKFKRVIAILAGPTGIGKTTTVAKLSAIFSLQHNAKVGLITSDTYRIAALEQLKTYAEILNIPIDVVYSPDNIEEVLKNHEDKDIVFIDTAGKSPSDERQQEEITELIEKSGATEVFLVISATTAFRDCLHIIDNYKYLKDYRIIITKTDETPYWGTILNVSYITGKNVSYIATGQNVPDDIEVLDPQKVINSLIGTDIL